MGLPITEKQVAAFWHYAAELADWNKRFNLTAITGSKEIQTRHFLDSLALLPVLAKVKLTTMAKMTESMVKAVDVGSGPGLSWPAFENHVTQAATMVNRSNREESPFHDPHPRHT